ncbi:MAG: hypothetical protein P4L84_31815 [Isosphaeraceae bacterium]|nr:hypothetical protein [Isosphaeraceae bacterium]
MAWTSFTLDEESPNQFEELPCPRCGEFLVIHAPDPSTPERMLGVCAECHSWYLLHCSECKMMRLPDAPGALARKPGRKGSGSPPR